MESWALPTHKKGSYPIGESHLRSTVCSSVNVNQSLQSANIRVRQNRMLQVVPTHCQPMVKMILRYCGSMNWEIHLFVKGNITFKDKIGWV